MAPGKTFVHKMDASELSALKDEGHGIIIYWLPRMGAGHDPHHIIYQKYPPKVLAAFSDEFGGNPKGADFITWDKKGVVKVVLDWMLECCDGDGLKPVKDISIDPTGLVSANDDGAFGRYFKTAYLFDFAQEYKMKHLKDKLKRELEFQAKGKFPIKPEEIYDMANYFYQPGRDKTAMTLMIDSIAKGYVKNILRPRSKYDAELALWEKDCNCHEQEFVTCTHDDLPEKVAKRVAYFQDPENEAELNEEFGKPKALEETAAEGGDEWSIGNDWNTGEDFNQPKGDRGGSEAFDEADKENQEPSSWAEDVNEEAAAAADQWGGAVAAGPTGGW